MKTAVRKLPGDTPRQRRRIRDKDLARAPGFCHLGNAQPCRAAPNAQHAVALPDGCAPDHVYRDPQYVAHGLLLKGHVIVHGVQYVTPGEAVLGIGSGIEIHLSPALRVADVDRVTAQVLAPSRA